MSFFEKFEVRFAENSDEKIVRRFVAEIRGEFGLVVPSDVETDLSDIEKNYRAPGLFLLITDPKTGRLVGTAALAKINASTVELRKFYLAREIRGQGHGRTILNFLIDWAGERELSRFNLETLGIFKVANKLYESMGFKSSKPPKKLLTNGSYLSLDLEERKSALG